VVMVHPLRARSEYVRTFVGRRFHPGRGMDAGGSCTSARGAGHGSDCGVRSGVEPPAAVGHPLAWRWPLRSRSTPPTPTAHAGTGRPAAPYAPTDTQLVEEHSILAEDCPHFCEVRHSSDGPFLAVHSTVHIKRPTIPQ
jgi:hypothetical protein